VKTWLRVGAVVHRLSRGVLRPWVWPLRLYWHVLDRALWAWWVMGGSELGVARFAWYRALEARFQRFYWAVYNPLLAWIAREIGE